MNIRKGTRVAYPPTRRVDQVDVCHGHEVRDPYRWLEDLDSAETKRWIGEQNAASEAYLSQIRERDLIRQRLESLWNYERHGVPFKQGGRYFYFRNSGLENQSVLYTMEGLHAVPRVLLDPNQLSGDGTVALTVFKPSPDGSLFAYGVSRSGSDWQEIRIREVLSGRDLIDRLEWVKFSEISWTSDGEGFFYSRFDAPGSEEKFRTANYYQKLFYHRLGTSQDHDILVYEDPEEKQRGFTGIVSEDGRYLIVHVSQGTDPRNRVYYRDLQSGPDLRDPGIVKLLDEFDAGYVFVGNQDTRFWFLTDLEAPRRRLVEIDVLRPSRGEWREILPEDNATLEAVLAVPGGFLACYLEDAHSRVEVCNIDGGDRQKLELPGLGTAAEISGKPDDTEAFFMYTSFTEPPTVYRYDVGSGELEIFRRPKCGIASEDFEARQIFFAAPDGTEIPMFIVHSRGLIPDGSHPLLLYGYGGFNVSLTPAFVPSRLAWIEMGGVCAVANIRGGGEYGEDWHRSGTGRNKQTGLDDFIAAAEWLIRSGYANRRRLAVTGASNGGMLVGACMTQRPDLFAAAVPSVGVMDLVRFHKFTIGWAWTSDYGSPDDPEDFAALYACSPYHNLRPGVAYPATLVTTGDHDDRVVPSHSFKFAAALQHVQSGENPVLIRVEVSAGHGAGKPTSKQIGEAADILAFLKQNVMK